MKKKVNGKVVDIDNIELFREAFEGLAMSKNVVSNISNTIEEETKLAKDCIECYHEVYKKLPFPLYSIESNIKYATIASYMKKKIKDITDIWVNEAIYVKIENNKYLKLAGFNWAIVALESSEKDNTDLEIYKSYTGYLEFKWVLEQLMKNKDLNSYYVNFMKDFIIACGKESMVIKWELSRLLDFGYVPKQIELKENSIIDLENNNDYFLDIFYNGLTKTKDTTLEIFIDKNGNQKINKRDKFVKAYDFDGYVKTSFIDDTGVSKETKSKMSKQDIDGLGSLFETILIKGLAEDRVESIKYIGIVSNDILIYQVDNTIYRCRLHKYEKSKEIANNVNLYGFENSKVYFYKDRKCRSGVVERTTYAFDLVSNKLKLCKIEYR